MRTERPTSLEGFGFVPRGEFRVRLYNDQEYQRLRQKHQDWPHEYILTYMGLEHDTGWLKNVITDQGRLRLAGIVAWSSSLNLFIHESTAPGDVDQNYLQYVYASQVPPQVIAPVSVLDRAALLQTRTATFGVPAVTRNINTVGVTSAAGVLASGKWLTNIVAFTVLPSTVVQTTVQTADVQHKVTWSFE